MKPQEERWQCLYIKRASTCTSVLQLGSSVCSDLLKRYEDAYLQTDLHKNFYGSFIHGLPKLKTAQGEWVNQLWYT